MPLFSFFVLNHTHCHPHTCNHQKTITRLRLHGAFHLGWTLLGGRHISMWHHIMWSVYIHIFFAWWLANNNCVFSTGYLCMLVVLSTQDQLVAIWLGDEGSELQCFHFIIDPGVLPPPTIVGLSIQQGILKFTWLPVLPNCTRLRYNITASGCGTCEIDTITFSSAICSNPPLSTVASVCSFTVYSEACGFSGTATNPFIVTLKGLYDM